MLLSLVSYMWALLCDFFLPYNYFKHSLIPRNTFDPNPWKIQIEINKTDIHNEWALSQLYCFKLLLKFTHYLYNLPISYYLAKKMVTVDISTKIDQVLSIYIQSIEDSVIHNRKCSQLNWIGIPA